MAARCVGPSGVPDAAADASARSTTFTASSNRHSLQVGGRLRVHDAMRGEPARQPAAFAAPTLDFKLRIVAHEDVLQKWWRNQRVGRAREVLG